MGASSRSPFRRASRKASTNVSGIEPLERRTLLSAAWSTALNDPTQTDVRGMAADHQGNVYSTGLSSTGVTAIREQAAGTTTWTTILQNGSQYHAIATDPAGNLFVGGADSSSHWVVMEKRAGQSGFSVVDSPSLSQASWASCVGLATDSAGDVYAIGGYRVTTVTKKTSTTTQYSIVRKLTLTSTGFSASTVYQISGPVTTSPSTLIAFQGVTSIDAGNSAGVYVVGRDNSGNWETLKSSNGGTAWSQVDSGHDTSASLYPPSVVGDLAGNVFVAGFDSNSSDWTVRKSSNGGASWTADDDYKYPGSLYSHSFGMGTDLAGNVYVVGQVQITGVGRHGVIRTNAGGSWSTVDDVSGMYWAFTVDSSGTLYAGGSNTTGSLIRCAPGPAPLAPAAAFSSMQIADVTDPFDDILHPHKHRRG
jgi:hypothetical protein